MIERSNLSRKDILSKNLYLHHIALTPGYVSRKELWIDNKAYPYKGRFGKGYIVFSANMKSTRYKLKEYWIEKE